MAEIRPTYLIMVTTANNNKYYNLFPEGDQFRVEYGRVDATKTTAYYPMSKWNAQISSKLKKGYKDVTDLKKDLVQEISIMVTELFDVVFFIKTSNKIILRLFKKKKIFFCKKRMNFYIISHKYFEVNTISSKSVGETSDRPKK